MVLDRRRRISIEHRHFYDIIDYLNPGDALVINETRVDSGAADRRAPQRWRVRDSAAEASLRPSAGKPLVTPGQEADASARRCTFGGGRLTATIAEVLPDVAAASWILTCEGTMEAALDELGEMPLPPYIHEKLAGSGSATRPSMPDRRAPPPRPLRDCISRPS